ncbi:MAG: metallophosphoesterase family protein [Clostridia bacterium]|nr:metallophosphoesterase family protein [Clostridia bacterium]
MEYFISDTHFGHKNCISLNSRPFDSLENMDNTMIERWNDRVKGGDTVYILGDLIHKSSEPEKYLKKLKGNKILIVGNHDEHWLRSLGFVERTKYGAQYGGYHKYFAYITEFTELSLHGTTVTMCHFPLVEWRASRKYGSKKLGFLIHGHIHNNRSEKYMSVFTAPHALNASADINGLMPVTYDELVENNEAFKLDVLNEPVKKAKFLAEKYHMHQSDKSGEPYFLHPAAVAAQLETDAEKCVGYMHDLLEDTDIDADVIERNFSQEVFAAVKTLTHAEGEDYFDYIARVKQNPLATRVKLADLAHNSDMSRLKVVTERDVARLEKYKKAKQILLNN